MPVPVPIPFTECLGLLDLMLTGEERGPNLNIKGVQCSVERIGSDAYWEAANHDFGLVAMFPGWYVGGHGLEVRILIVGDHILCMQWLPIDAAEKRAIIERLPLDQVERTLCTLAV